jgi:hypothetical protein
MQFRAVLRRVPIVGALAVALKRRLQKPGFINSADYWERRYRTGGTSGAGSYNRLAEFKAAVINDFVAQNNIRSVIEFGSGDGAQLKLASYPTYVGVDVSRAAVVATRKLFADDPTKSFLHSSELPRELHAELSLSLDVIYHLVEDGVFETYMRDLFEAASRFVIIYSSNVNEPGPSPHVRHRRFTDWVEGHAPDFELSERVSNPFAFDPNDPDNTSFADFFVYARGRPADASQP